MGFQVIISLFLVLGVLAPQIHAEINQTHIPFFTNRNAELMWGYVDTNGNVTIPPNFQMCGLFVDELASVMISNRWGYINKKGNLIIKPVFRSASAFSEGLAVVKSVDKGDMFLSEGGYGYIDKQGELATEPIYNRAMPFSDGLAYVEMETTGGYIDKMGTLIYRNSSTWWSFS